MEVREYNEGILDQYKNKTKHDIKAYVVIIIKTNTRSIAESCNRLNLRSKEPLY